MLLAVVLIVIDSDSRVCNERSGEDVAGVASVLVSIPVDCLTGSGVEAGSLTGADVRRFRVQIPA